MRDIALLMAMCVAIPYIIRDPWIGVVIGTWISLMNPHRFAWGFAYNFPFAFIVALLTVGSVVLGKKKIEFPRHPITYLIIALPLWFTVTLVFAIEPERAFEQWQRVWKVFVLVLLAGCLIKNRIQIMAMMWVMTISIGWYGLKGGIFTILTGGGQRVYGPPGGSYISDNNAIAVALVMVIPLMFFLMSTVERRLIKLGLLAMALFSLVAVLGSQSRGALLAVLVMSVFLWLKSRRKILFGTMLFGTLLAAVAFMPSTWDNRMRSIETYEQDSSAMGRINTWTMAFNLANDRPIVGGGFEVHGPTSFKLYAPDPNDVHSAHSIYFQMLGEHGYVGLLLFLLLGFVGWITAWKIAARSRGSPDNQWAGNLARSIQVSLIGFAVGGAFVNISYWELQYYELMMLVATYRLLSEKTPAGQQVHASAVTAHGAVP